MNQTIFERNRAAWNEALEYHQRARNNALQAGFEDPAFSTLDRDCDGILMGMLDKLDLRGKAIAQLPCNNGRELLSLMRLLGADQAVGFDISDAAIEEARQLAAIAKLNAKFERVNLLELGGEYDNRFDFIYISEGSLQWFPDLDEYFSVVSRLLKPDGQILVFEIHPFAYVNGKLKQDPNYATSYFVKGPYSYADGLDYVGGVSYEAKECCWFMHKMSDILGAIRRSGIELLEFDEYGMEMANDPMFQGEDRYPLSYTVTGRKK